MLCYDCLVEYFLKPMAEGGLQCLYYGRSMIMNIILLSIITIASVVLVVVLIYVLLEVLQATRKLERFITMSEDSLKPTLDELPGTVRSIRHIAENI